MYLDIYNKLAKKYDFATKLVSFGIEDIWRKIFISNIKKFIKDGVLLDIASATGENGVKLCFKKEYLIDPSEEMNKIAFHKLKNKCPDIEFKIIKDTAENFKLDEKVDLVTAFMAIRNFDDIQKGMSNIKAHLNKDGYFAIVEMVNSNSIFAKLIFWYMNNIVPLIAGILFRMKDEYKFLGDSISKLDESIIIDNLEGFDIVVKKRLLFIATLIIAKKR